MLRTILLPYAVQRVIWHLPAPEKRRRYASRYVRGHPVGSEVAALLPVRIRLRRRGHEVVDLRGNNYLIFELTLPPLGILEFREGTDLVFCVPTS